MLMNSVLPPHGIESKRYTIVPISLLSIVHIITAWSNYEAETQNLMSSLNFRYQYQQ